MYGCRWERFAISNRVRIAAPADHYLDCEPEHDHRWQQRDARLVFHERDRVYRLGRLVRQQSDQRLSNDGCAHGQCDLHTDLYRRRGQCDTVSDRLGDPTDTCGHVDCNSQHGSKWGDVDVSVVVHERDFLRGLRRLDRREVHRRHPSDGRDERNDYIHAHLHRNGRLRIPVCDHHRDCCAAERVHWRESHEHCERRYSDVDLDIDERDSVYCLGRLDRK